MGLEAAAIAVGGTMAAGGIASGILSGQAAASSADASLYSARANAQASAMESAASAQQMRMSGATQLANAKISAANYDAQADYYLRQAGNFQLQGRQERENVGLQLLQAKGDIVASAAGSGIDVSSRVVEKTTNDAVKQAYASMETSARNEYENAYGAMQASKTARVNADNSLAIGEWANSAYNSMADQTEAYGAITAQNILTAGYAERDAGYDSAVASTVSGVFGGIGSGLSSGIGIAAL